MQGALPSAQASAFEYGLGAGVLYRSPQEVRAFVLAEVQGLSFTGLRAEAALGANHGAASGLVWAGPTLSLDFATWVPVLFAGIGYRIGPRDVAGTVRAELRRYVTLHSAITIGAGAEWTLNNATQFSAALGYHYN